jgi:Tfp pilus assembly protein PilX
MSISVYEQLNNMGLNIDRATLQQVSQSILKRAEEKNSQYKVDNTQNFFQKRDIGIDLYSEKIDIKLANQIALNNTNLQIHLNQDTLTKINYLNSMAAQNSKNAADGKVIITTGEITLDDTKRVTNNTNRITTKESAKDKNGSNPFYNGELLMTAEKSAKNEDNEENTSITKSIFA